MVVTNVSLGLTEGSGKPCNTLTKEGGYLVSGHDVVRLYAWLIFGGSVLGVLDSGGTHDGARESRADTESSPDLHHCRRQLTRTSASEGSVAERCRCVAFNLSKGRLGGISSRLQGRIICGVLRRNIGCIGKQYVAAATELCPGLRKRE